MTQQEYDKWLLGRYKYMLRQSRNRFTNPEFGVNWQDAANAISNTLALAGKVENSIFKEIYK